MPEFLLPDLGEGLTEAEVVTWLVDVGDRVEIDQVVVEVETAKASVEVPVPFAGTVQRLFARTGESVPVGSPLIAVAGEGSGGGSAAGDRAAESGTADDDEGFREPGVVTAGSGNVLIGYGTPAPAAPGARRRRRPGAGPAVVPEPAAPAAVAAPTAGGPRTATAVISPLVRKMARAAAVDVDTVVGSGPRGLVLRQDVEQAIAAARPAPATGPVAASRSADDDVARIPLTGLRRVVADKLTRSRREIPEATVWVDVDATALLAARAELNSHEPERPVGVLALLARFAILGLAAYPELNGRVEADEIVVPSGVNLGFAAQTPRGLMVPVVHGASTLSTRDLAGELAALTAAARDGGLAPAQLSGGTFTVNNYGVFGVDGSAAIINHPEVAILGIGRIIDRPWVHRGELAVRKVTQLTLAFDHRVCDGGTAGGFLRFVADRVESPVLALG